MWEIVIIYIPNVATFFANTLVAIFFRTVSPAFWAIPWIDFIANIGNNAAGTSTTNRG